MCTCITYKNGDFYFGRNLDLDSSFGEKVTVTPRNFPLDFRMSGRDERHYAMIGMASADERFPLYAEAVNEKWQDLISPDTLFTSSQTERVRNLLRLK